MAIADRVLFRGESWIVPPCRSTNGRDPTGMGRFVLPRLEGGGDCNSNGNGGKRRGEFPPTIISTTCILLGARACKGLCMVKCSAAWLAGAGGCGGAGGAGGREGIEVKVEAEAGVGVGVGVGESNSNSADADGHSMRHAACGMRKGKGTVEGGCDKDNEDDNDDYNNADADEDLTAWYGASQGK